MLNGCTQIDVTTWRILIVEIQSFSLPTKVIISYNQLNRWTFWITFTIYWLQLGIGLLHIRFCKQIQNYGFLTDLSCLLSNVEFMKCSHICNRCVRVLGRARYGRQPNIKWPKDLKCIVALARGCLPLLWAARGKYARIAICILTAHLPRKKYRTLF